MSEFNPEVLTVNVLLMQVNKLVQKQPITSVSGTKVNIMGTSDVNIGGSAVETNAKVVNSQSQATDEKQASFLGQIMSQLRNSKNS